jgi:hypothetical protein
MPLDERMELFLGFLLGIVASAIAALLFDHATGPRLEIVCNRGTRAIGDVPDGTRQEFHHVVVRNTPAGRMLPSRRPAWACQATISAFKWTGEPLTVVPVLARWSSQPEPISTFFVVNQMVQAADLAKMIAGRRIDIYSHKEERLVVAIKHQGSEALHLFSNESYQFEHGRNPAWRLDAGTYRFRVTIHYERGTVHQDFEVGNTGTGLDDVKIRPWRGSVTA